MDKMKRMQELVELLNKAGKAYYQDAQEIMSNYEYDALYDELKGLEEELGTVMASSPTVNVGYEVLSELPKERHESPMLSLDKTKEVARLKEFVGDQMAVISWKMDGLTIVLTYRDGELFKAVTRGNGEVGEVITNNAKVFKNVPLHIPYKGELPLFGYIKAYKSELRMKDYEVYRAVYCTLCRELGRSFGPFARFTLNYDFTFLAVLMLSLSPECTRFKLRV